MNLWEEGNINGLLEVRRTKKGRLPSNTKPMIIEKWGHATNGERKCKRYITTVDK